LTALEEGIEKGRAEGRAEGIEKGIEKGMIQIAERLLAAERNHAI